MIKLQQRALATEVACASNAAWTGACDDLATKGCQHAQLVIIWWEKVMVCPTFMVELLQGALATEVAWTVPVAWTDACNRLPARGCQHIQLRLVGSEQVMIYLKGWRSTARLVALTVNVDGDSVWTPTFVISDNAEGCQHDYLVVLAPEYVMLYLQGSRSTGRSVTLIVKVDEDLGSTPTLVISDSKEDSFLICLVE